MDLKAKYQEEIVKKYGFLSYEQSEHFEAEYPKWLEKEHEALLAQNKKLAYFLLDPMLPQDEYPNVIRFNREVYNLLFDKLLKRWV